MPHRASHHGRSASWHRALALASVLSCLLLAAAPAPALTIDSDFEGASIRVTSIDASAQAIKFMPGGDPKRGWPCWWSFRAEGLDAGKPLTLELRASDLPMPQANGAPSTKPLAAEWSMPGRAVYSTDGKTWQQTPPGSLKEGTMSYQVPSGFTSLLVAWGPSVVVGLQRHYQNSYRELYAKMKAGMIGDITSAQAWWNNEGVWVNPRKAGQTEMEYQMRNWYYFNWLCGDHIVEQHIHNIDVINWFKGGYPVKAQGMGGREVRKGKEFGEIFDHHYVEFQYADGSVLNSQCRHIKGTFNKVDEQIVGTKGTIYCGDMNITDRSGKVVYQFDKTKENNPYQTEHDELFEAIAKGEYKFADADNGARTTMTAILGRLATYTGVVVEFEKALNSGMTIMPTTFDWNATPPVVPDKDGFYPIAVPGVTKYFS